MNIALSDLFRPFDRAWSALRRHWAGVGEPVPRTVSLLSHGLVTVDVACDFTGETCLRTNLVTKRVLDECAPGMVIEIVSDNLSAVETIPFMLAGHGCVHLGTMHLVGSWKIYARKQGADDGRKDKMTEGVVCTTEGVGSATSRANAFKASLVVGAFLLLSVWTYSVDARYLYFSAYLWFGFIYGMSLQYGRFCMASAIRDLFAVGVPRMAVGIMIAVVLFSLVSAAVTVAGKSTFHASPIGMYSVVGGAIFGFGMVFTGGCATGSLYKTGEGSVSALLVVLSLSFAQAFFVDIGGALDALVPASWHASAAAKALPAGLTATQGWYDQFLAGYVWDLQSVTVGEAIGFENPVAKAFIGNSLLNAILPAIAILAVIYAIWYRKGYLRRHKDAAPGAGREFAGWWSMVTASKRTAIAGLVLGVAAGLQMWVMQTLQQKFGVINAGELLMALGHTSGLSIQDTVFDPGYFYVTTQEAQGAGWLLAQLGMNITDNIFFGMENGIPSPIANPVLWMSFSVVGGSMVMALLANEFKLKFPTLEIAIWAIGGGILMGIGARIGLGCNIGAFFATVTNGDPSGWLFGLGMTLGGYLGVKFFNWWIERKMAKESPLGF